MLEYFARYIEDELLVVSVPRAKKEGGILMINPGLGAGLPEIEIPSRVLGIFSSPLCIGRPLGSTQPVVQYVSKVLSSWLK
jgi:hypothetical protein